VTTTDQEHTEDVAFGAACHREPMLRFFAYRHLPTPVREISERFYALALDLERALPRNAERTITFRKLLEAKNWSIGSR
jgi:hypothetical protein